MLKPRLVFVGHSYHQKTGSTDFLIRILEEDFDVTALWDEGWLDKRKRLRPAAINALAPAHVLFFQELPRPRSLRRIRCANLTWVPMYDSLIQWRRFWRRYRGAALKALHFTQASLAEFAPQGFESLAVRYYPEPAPARARAAGKPRVFCWLRRADVGWSTVKSLLSGTPTAGFVLRYAPDPREQIAEPDAAEVRALGIELHRGWMSREQYLELLSACDVFVAPRRLEGIGMATLEAMGLGMAVIGADAPSFNEYVENGRTGYVFDADAPRPLDLADWAAVGARARASVVAGRAAWLAQQAGIRAFVRKPAAQARSRGWQLLQHLGL